MTDEELRNVIAELGARISRVEDLLKAIYDRDECDITMHELRNELYAMNRVGIRPAMTDRIAEVRAQLDRELEHDD